MDAFDITRARGLRMFFAKDDLLFLREMHWSWLSAGMVTNELRTGNADLVCQLPVIPGDTQVNLAVLSKCKADLCGSVLTILPELADPML